MIAYESANVAQDGIGARTLLSAGEQPRKRLGQRGSAGLERGIKGDRRSVGHGRIMPSALEQIKNINA